MVKPLVRTPDDHLPKKSFGVPQPVGRAVILAAGKGSRLERLAGDVPKCLVEIDGQPLLERALHALASQGVVEAVIVVGYMGEAVRELCYQQTDYGIISCKYSLRQCCPARLIP